MTDPTSPSSLGARVAQAAPSADLESRRLEAASRARVLGIPVEPPRVGRYVLLERLGAGSMGEVYSAYDDRLERKVALKLMLPELEAPAGERILREARALAQLSHPHIVHVYEVEHFEGRLFIAMELVRGESLRQWLRAEPRTWRTVLDVVIQAGRGLAAAHAAGLVHRDVKPDNVLVGADGRARIADFGLARSTSDTSPPSPPGGGEDASVRLTQTGTRVGTPAYMAPEVWRGAEADAASDQFSFCAMMYEALFDALPFAGANSDELRAAVLAGRLQRPPRGPVPARVRAALERGLSMTPAARHANLDALLTALAPEPRRQRLGVVAATVVGLGLVAGVVARPGADAEATCAQAGTELGQVWSPTRADAVRAALSREGRPFAMDTALRVVRGLDAHASAWARERRAACEASHVYKVQSPALLDLRTACLDRSAREMEGLLHAFTQAGPATLESAVDAVSRLSAPSRCADLEALQRLPSLPEAPAARAAIDAVRARLDHARAEELSGRYAEGLAEAREALTRADVLDYPPVRAEALFQVGRLQAATGKLVEAVASLSSAVDLAEAHRADDVAADLWTFLTRTAVRELEAPREGRDWSRRASAALARIGVTRGPRRAELTTYLGRLEYVEGQPERAEPHHREAVAMLREAGNAPVALASALLGLANALESRGDTGPAVAAYEESLALMEAELGPGHPQVARALHDLGTLELTMGRMDSSRTRLERALALWSAAHGDWHRDVGRAHLALTSLMLATGRRDEALEHARRARDIYRRVLPEGHPARADAELSLGVVHYWRRELEPSLEAYRSALDAQRLALPPGHAERIQTLSYLGETLVQLGRHAEAVRILEEAEAELARDAGGNRERLRALVLASKGGALLRLGRLARARDSLEEALRLREATPGRPVDLADVRWTLARVLDREGREACRARRLAQDALDVYATLKGAGAERAKQVSDWLAGPRRCRETTAR
ncbi:protein kinase domain-containing protein [Myxococcus eversor]|uniref:protein kinase domain-containing protein n=1 Tax=Myxococcus eversor TaxID=2709661 RepID=UPI0013D5D84D|nr:tetratricopeptide repeat protein [Myxococcus eversor]